MDLQLWCMFFCSVYSFQHHPGKVRVPLGEQMSIADCARIADLCLQECKKREALWRGSDLQ